MKNQESKRKMLIGAFTFVMAFGMTNSITASSWRIGTSTYKPHFTSISEAMSSENVQDGDTLYLDPGISLASSTVTKAVTIVGTGYFLSDYAQSESSIAGLNLNAENIKVEGCSITGTVVINSPNICMERCYVNGYINMNNQEKTVIKSCYVYCNSRASNSISGGLNSILENNLIFLYYSGVSSSATAYNATINNMSGCILKNNYISRVVTASYASYISYGRKAVIVGFSNCEVCNNIILNESYHTNYSSASFTELEYTFDSMTNCTIYHNLLSSSSNALYPYNLFNKRSSSIFVSSGSNDKAYMLSASSPAKGYATDGGDCGPYGGSNPYVASGLPFGHPYNVKMNITLPDTDGILKISSDTRIQNQ